MNEIEECDMCQKPLKDKIFVFDNGIHCSIECCRENCSHLKGYSDDEVKEIKRNNTAY